MQTPRNSHPVFAAERRDAFARRAQMRPVRWSFDDGATFDGFTDGTTWNGFSNVWVTQATHAQVVEWWKENAEQDEALQAEFAAMPADAAGLVSYANGFATTIEEDA